MTGIRSGWLAIVAMVGIASIIVWIWAVAECWRLSNRVNEVGDRFDASAIQISQVADQALLRAVAHLAVAGGATALFLVVAIFAFADPKRSAS